MEGHRLFSQLSRFGKDPLEELMPKVTVFFLVIVTAVFLSGSYLQAEGLSKEEVRRIQQRYLERRNLIKWTKNSQKVGMLRRIRFADREYRKDKELERKGLILVTELEKPFFFKGLEPEGKTAYGFQFTNKATPYLAESSGILGEKAYIELIERQSFEVVDFKKIASHETKADIMVGYKLTPYGEILLGRGIMVQRKEGALFEAQDEGWRVKIKINF